jgi:hypothetical protein
VLIITNKRKGQLKMYETLEELRTTIEVNKEDMKGDKDLTNDLVVEDFLVILGYNRKRDKQVRKVSDAEVDWTIIKENLQSMAFKVYPININIDEIEPKEIDRAAEYCNQKDLNVLVVTNGSMIKIFRTNLATVKGYEDVCKINLIAPVSDNDAMVLDAISKEKFNLVKLEEVSKASAISTEKILKVLGDNKSELNTFVLKLLGMGNADEKQSEKSLNILSELLISSNITDTSVPNNPGLDDNSSENSSAEKLTELETKLTETESKNTELQTKVTELETKLAESESKLIESENRGAEENSEKLAEMESKNTELQNKVTEMESKNTELQNKVTELENQSTELQTKIAEFKNQNTELETLRTEKESLITQLNESRGNTDEVESLKNQLNEYQGKNVDLENQIKELTDKNAELQKTVSDIENNQTTSSEELDKLNKELSDIRETNTDLEDKNKSLSEQLESEKQDKEALETKYDTLNAKVAELEAENNKLKSEVSSVDTEALEKERAELKNQLDTLKTEKETLENENKSLKEEVEHLKEEVETVQNESELSGDSEGASEIEGMSSKEAAAVIDSYREKIVNLTSEVANMKIELNKAKKEAQDAIDQMNNMSGMEQRKAKELLACIEDSDTMPRHYVAVVNTELMQYDEIHTFVGRVLQKLYELKNYAASQYIFNADVFVLNQASVRNDLLMNNKTYDVEFDSNNEDDILNKLRIVFSHFDDIVFECKKIGNPSLTSSNMSYGSSENTNESGSYEYENNNTEVSEEYQDTEYSSESSEGSYEEQDNGYDYNSNSELLLVSQLTAIDSLIWNDEPIEFKSIPYLGSNSVTYNINKNNELSNNEQILCKCIDAALAISSYESNTNIVQEFKHKDLSSVSNFIKLYTEEYRDCTRIKGTKYVVTPLESLQQVAAVLFDVCQALNISTDEIFIYFYADTESDMIINDWGYSEDAVQLREYTDYEAYLSEYEVEEDDTKIAAILKGDLFDHITVTKNSLQAHQNIIGKVVAVKTKYAAKAFKSTEDIRDIVIEILQEAKKCNIPINTNAFGSALGTKYKLLSEVQDEVGPDAIEIDLVDETYYLCNVEEWQLIYTLIKMHTTLFNNGAISIKAMINPNALKFYMEEFETSEPTLGLAVRSLVEYINNNTQKK